jgi:hypothetical protein
MPGYKGHLAGGFFVFVVLMLLLSHCNPTACTALQWLSCALAGSLFPDIDVKSRGQNWFYWALFAIFLWLFACKSYFLLSILAIISLIPLLVRHRGLFHKLWFIGMLAAGILCGVAAWAPAYFTMAAFDVLFFCAGVISHLWLDLGIRKMIRW